MNFTLPKIILENKVETVILAVLLMTAFAATQSNQAKPITEVQQRTLEVQDMMNGLTAQPPSGMSNIDYQNELKNAQTKLVNQYIWANRQSQTPDIIKFSAFLETCNQKLIAYSKN